MKMSLVLAPLLLGTLIAGVLVLLALLALLTSNSRWDDHLINAIGVFVAGAFLSLTLWLVTAAFRPRPGTSKRARVISIVSLIGFALLVGAGIAVAASKGQYSAAELLLVIEQADDAAVLEWYYSR